MGDKSWSDYAASPSGQLEYCLQEKYELQQKVAAIEAERDTVAILTAHRACHSAEHDPLNGKIHGWCVVCGLPWPCEYADGSLIKSLKQDLARAREALRLAIEELSDYGQRHLWGPELVSPEDAYELAIDKAVGILKSALTPGGHDGTK